MKSGPDVFADALVSRAVADAGALILQIPKPIVLVVRSKRAARFAGRADINTRHRPRKRAIQYCEALVINRKAAEYWIPAFRGCSNGYRFAKRQGKPNSAGK